MPSPHCVVCCCLRSVSVKPQVSCLSTCRNPVVLQRFKFFYAQLSGAISIKFHECSWNLPSLTKINTQFSNIKFLLLIFFHIRCGLLAIEGLRGQVTSISGVQTMVRYTNKFSLNPKIWTKKLWPAAWSWRTRQIPKLNTSLSARDQLEKPTKCSVCIYFFANVCISHTPTIPITLSQPKSKHRDFCHKLLYLWLRDFQVTQVVKNPTVAKVATVGEAQALALWNDTLHQVSAEDHQHESLDLGNKCRTAVGAIS